MAQCIQIQFFVNLAVCLLALSAVASCAPAGKRQKMGYRDAAKYMKKFGWYHGDIDGLSDDELQKEIEGPLNKLKKHYSIGDDGTFDQNTEDFMKKPRCEKPDNNDDKNQGERKKRWTRLGDSVWTTTPVTLSFKNYSGGAVPPSVQEKLAQECGDMWASQSGLKVKVLPFGQAANIIVSFEYVDGKPFGTVGLGQSPTPWSTDGSYLHMDDAETWRERMSSPGGGVPMLSVLCHEMGHNLGMGHSADATAVMYPTVTDAVLSSDDILGIQTLYPKTDTSASSTTTAASTTTQQPATATTTLPILNTTPPSQEETSGQSETDASTEPTTTTTTTTMATTAATTVQACTTSARRTTRKRTRG